jgi:1,4-alpha-glucan branching enzyme
MNNSSSQHAQAYFNFTLHAHLPYVVNHGTWPHGLEWLLEAAAETYLPLLRVLDRLERDGISLKANINITPILLEQLRHPVFQAELVQYCNRKIAAAEVDEKFYREGGESHFAQTARFWQSYYGDALATFEALDRDIVAGFRHFDEIGSIEVITCGATHGYFPLLGTDESIAAQVETAVRTHERHMGRKPRGMWLPECGYRPAGPWQAPMTEEGRAAAWPPFYRRGVEELVGEHGIRFFFVDTSLIEKSMHFTPYELLGARKPSMAEFLEIQSRLPHRTFSQPYYVDGPTAQEDPVAAFPRDPRTGVQVWSGESGYPGEPMYLDFHKKRWPGGHRYWQVTSAQLDMAFKTAYHPELAAEKTRGHAEHFVSLVYSALAPGLEDRTPPIVTSPFDAELFGHWWFEGPMFLENVARIIARKEVPIALITGSEYLDAYGAAGFMALPEGSWGKNGSNEVWLNPDTKWTWPHIYQAERFVRSAAALPAWRIGAPGNVAVAAPDYGDGYGAPAGGIKPEKPETVQELADTANATPTETAKKFVATSIEPHTAGADGTETAAAPRVVLLSPYAHRPIGTRLMQQICRELLLMESSDWQFLITTISARDYAEERFAGHTNVFHELEAMWKRYVAGETLTPAELRRLIKAEVDDGVFPDIDPSLWAQLPAPRAEIEAAVSAVATEA